MRGLVKVFMAASMVLAFSVVMAGHPLMAGVGNGKTPPGQAKTPPGGGNVGAPSGEPGLKAHVLKLEAEVAVLQGQVASLQTKFTNLSSIVAAINANNALDLGPYVTVDPNAVNGLKGPNIFFHDANVHIVSGSGETDDFGALRGLGNLAIGYNEAPFPLGVLDRAGSHNLIVGPLHKYPSFGGVVAGSANTISGKSASVTGGQGNAAEGDRSSVSGGAFRNVTGLDNWAAGGLFQAN